MSQNGNSWYSGSRRHFLKTTGAASAAGLVGLAGCLGDDEEGEFPYEPLRMIIPYGPGGGSDLIGRQYAPFYSDILDVDVEVENVPGGASLRGQGEVFSREQDGHHFTMTHIPSTPGAALLQDPGWDPRDFTHMGGCAFYVVGIFANPQYEFQGFNDIVDRYNDGEFSRLGGLGYGHTFHLISLILREEAGWDWQQWIDYDGTGDLVAAVTRDEVPAGVTGTSALPPHHIEGDIDILTVLYSGGDPVVRAAGIEDEIEVLSDVSDVNIDTFGSVDRAWVLGPDVPDDRLEVLEDATQQAAEDSEMVEWREETGQPVRYRPGDEIAADMDEAYQMLQDQIDFDQIREQLE